MFDRPKYRQHNIIERMFGCLKENRKIVTRFDKLQKAMPPWSHWLVPCGVCNKFFVQSLACWRYRSCL
ncbi:transposase [Pseudomonas sp. RW4S2]|uniref:Transposase n=1 Tax=Pseudomonas vlassakiae TaxID=485888 RepID=A0ABS6R0I9_9PSED|nr:transposase [Pseudomonas vlassakiae]